MGKRRPYILIYAPEARSHLASIEPRYLGLILSHIEEQLSFAPLESTRNRKPLRDPAPFGAAWELRFGPDNRFRILYDVNQSRHTVTMLAIGAKEGNRLRFAGQEMDS
jgi:hypothetical protein